MEGEFVDWDDAKLHLLTHTMHYGMGAFEGIRAYKRADGHTAIFRLEEHLTRLFDSCKLMLLEPRFNQEQVRVACVQLLRENRMDEAYLRPMILLMTCQVLEAAGMKPANIVRLNFYTTDVDRFMGAAVPDELFVSNISSSPVGAAQTDPTMLLSPTIDGEETSYFEWLGGGRYEAAFRYRAPPGTKAVYLAGEFNGWKPDGHKMDGPDAEGRFTTRVELKPGRQLTGRQLIQRGAGARVIALQVQEIGAEHARLPARGLIADGFDKLERQIRLLPQRQVAVHTRLGQQQIGRK